ncbi:Hypothetical protein PHPALM_9765 [Phytophthora palmivora]|uniref:Uncharacterized protein n=1 Tax=Phytophthora palmivora TaxID=4796 RepID=A0A2P4Y6E9_9STRA|nr:Hypothetical protein PHPALM_9765 [Phytophthora palmivora]
MLKEPKHTFDARFRSLDPTARDAIGCSLLITIASPNLPSSHKAEANIKCAPEIEKAFVSYLEDNCLLSLEQMQDMACVEPLTSNGDENIGKRRQSAVQLMNHMAQGSFIVCFDDTNFNLYCSVLKVKHLKVMRLPPSKGKRLQVQYAILTDMGLICFEIHRGSVNMEYLHSPSGRIVHLAGVKHQVALNLRLENTETPGMYNITHD